MKTKRIGFVGGGNMAGALVKGLLAARLVEPAQVRVSDVRPERLKELADGYGIGTTLDNAELAAWADVLVLAVKPQVTGKVLPALGRALRAEAMVISIAAGVSLRALEEGLGGAARVVRAMPNAAAMALASATAIVAGSRATAADMGIAQRLFDSVGRVVALDESLLDAVTGLSGSGPAYVMMMIEALADGGVKVGLPRDTALMLAAQTVLGSARLLLETGEHPGRLKDIVASPAGTTIAGLHALEVAGLRGALMTAVEAATHRSQELGQKKS